MNDLELSSGYVPIDYNMNIINAEKSINNIAEGIVVCMCIHKTIIIVVYVPHMYCNRYK